MSDVTRSLKDKRVVITGGTGFLGAHLRECAEKLRLGNCFLLGSRDYDLTLPPESGRLVRELRPDILIHAAAVCGGIGANRAEPGRFFYENIVMGIHLIEAAMRGGVSKFVQIGTVCSYPKFAPAPFREVDIWDGFPEETNAPYGIAKKMLLTQLQSYRQQYDFRGIYLVPVNLYGPYDNFDSQSSHVIPAMIRKFDAAIQEGLKEVVCWGDGTPTREFLFAADAAKGIFAATALYGEAEPVNLGTGQEISIRDLADKIAQLSGFQGRIRWDASKPNGQLRRTLDTSSARELFRWSAETPLDEGLRKTIEWYRAEKPAEQRV